MKVGCLIKTEERGTEYVVLGLVKPGKWLEALARREPHLFVHWAMGIFYTAG